MELSGAADACEDGAAIPATADIRELTMIDVRRMTRLLRALERVMRQTADFPRTPETIFVAATVHPTAVT